MTAAISADWMRALLALPPEQQSLVFSLLTEGVITPLLVHLPVPTQAELLTCMDGETLVRVLEGIPAQERQSLLRGLPLGAIELLLEKMTTAFATKMAELLPLPQLKIIYLIEKEENHALP